MRNQLRWLCFKAAFLVAIFTLISPIVIAMEPFFDNDPTTYHAPEAPIVDRIDRQVLALCGGWGDRVDARDFELFLLDADNHQLLDNLFHGLEGIVYRKSYDKADFVKQIRRAWFEQKGFKHIFCGEPNVGKDLGGFHYAPRYVQAQKMGWAGYNRLAKSHRKRTLKKCRRSNIREKLSPPIFSTSIQYKYRGEVHSRIKCQGGYHIEMNAERLLLAVTDSFRQAIERVDNRGTHACLYQSQVDGVDNHYSKMVVKRGAIRTFYPLIEKRPYCRKDKRDFRRCLCARL